MKKQVEKQKPAFAYPIQIQFKGEEEAVTSQFGR